MCQSFRFRDSDRQLPRDLKDHTRPGRRDGAASLRAGRTMNGKMIASAHG